MTEELELGEGREAVRRDYLTMVVRRRWYLLAPLFLCGLAGSVVARVWPLLYRSEALILVEQQRIPEQYVTPNVITNLQTRLELMTQQILSRTRLQRLIEDFGLYRQERARMAMDEAIDRMRSRIAVEVVRTPGRPMEVAGFRVYFSADDPRVAQRVTNELTSMFIDESLRTRTQQSENTTSFLENQLEEARKELDKQEQQVREYKLQYLGELPEQRQANLQILSSLEAQLYSVNATLDRAEQQKTYLEALRSQFLETEKRIAAQIGTPAGQRALRGGVGPATAAAEATLAELRRRVSELRTRYTADHPDLRSAEAMAAEWERIKAKLEADELARARGEAAAAADAARPPVEEGPNPALIEADSRLKAVAMEIENLKNMQEALRARIQEFQTRLNMTPVREQQMADLTRTHANARAHYESLLNKKLQSELASNLEKRQQGEQFRILDPASLPVKPEGRLKILAGSWMLGLCLGIGLAALREFTTQVINDEPEVTARLSPGVPVFRVPVIRTPSESRRRKWVRAFEASAALVLLAASAASSLKTYLAS